MPRDLQQGPWASVYTYFVIIIFKYFKGLRNSTAPKCTYSCRGLWFNSQRPHGHSQLTSTPVPGDPTSSSDLRRHQECMECPDLHKATLIHKKIKYIQENAIKKHNCLFLWRSFGIECIGQFVWWRVQPAHRYQHACRPLHQPKLIQLVLFLSYSEIS